MSRSMEIPEVRKRLRDFALSPMCTVEDCLDIKELLYDHARLERNAQRRGQRRTQL